MLYTMYCSSVYSFINCVFPQNASAATMSIPGASTGAAHSGVKARHGSVVVVKPNSKQLPDMIELMVSVHPEGFMHWFIAVSVANEAQVPLHFRCV